jgi:hypothetical protein
MRIDKKNFDGLGSFQPEKEPPDSSLDLPKTSGIEKKGSRDLFKAENKKLMVELAGRLGRKPSFLWMLHDEKTGRRAGEVLRQLLLRGSSW